MRGDSEAVRYGATSEEWGHWDLILGLGEHLLPVVSNPNAVISAQSKMKGLGKTPSRYNGQREVAGFSEWTKVKATPNQLKAWAQESDYGICLQARAVRGLDIDVDDQEEADAIACRIAELSLEADWPMRWRANSGKKLIAVRVEGELAKRSFKTKSGLVEFLADGQQFIVAGTHPSGVRYEWAGGPPDEIPSISMHNFERLWRVLVAEFAIEAPRESSLRQVKSGADLDVEDDVAEYLIEHWETFGTDRGKLYVTCPWKDGHSSDSGETESAWLLAGGKGYELGHYLCLHASCTGRKDEDFLDAVGYRAAQFECLPTLITDEGDAPWDGESPRLPLPGFKRDKSGAIEATIDNVRAAIDRIDVCGMDVRHDQFKGEIVWCVPGSGEWQTFYDQHYTELRIRLERLGFKPVGRELIRDVVHYRANQRAIDTAMVWLDGLVWDGKPRVEKFWSTYFGTEDTPYTRACGLYIWSAMAGRVLEPGVQADMVPILTGAQGVGKSRGVAALSPSPAYATVMSFHENETERARKMRGRLVAELAELQGLRSRDLEEIKAWISKSEENWTPKYMEMATVYRRRLVLFGTTNDDEFLADPSGERRWLPMEIRAVDVEAIKKDCLQLWAEGRERFAKEGVIWRPAQTLAAAEHGAYRLVDSWEEAVERWLNETDIAGDTPLTLGFVTTTSALLGALGFAARNIKKADEMRMGRILHAQGFVRVLKRLNGKPQRIWQPPETT